MATAKLLPSGSYRIRVFIGKENGKNKYKSFTAPSKREAEHMADIYLENEKEVRSELTFDKAFEMYINSRESVLSPRTIKEYKRSRKADFNLIKDVNLTDITQNMIQNLVNEKAKTKSPKTVKNIHGTLFAVMKEYRPSFVINTTLPQKVRPDLYIPNDNEVKILLEHCNDKDMRIAIMLAAFGPMRRSEICGLESTDIKKGIAHVKRAIVMNDKNEWVEKTTKSYSGDRYIPLPGFVIDEIKGVKGRIVKLMPNMVSDRFIDIQKATGLPHFRFHDLRHYCASVLHANGMPDAYIIQRCGWSSDAVLKQIYRHALSDRVDVENTKANEYFSKIYDTKNDTK